MALAWCFRGEASSYADAVLVALEGKTLLVPAIWALEVANAILTGQRAKRLGQREVNTFTMLLQNLPIVQDVQPITACMASVLPLAAKHNLSAYDAAYLELSIRRGAALATLDRNLQSAALRTRVPIFPGGPGHERRP
jgi:predicted nucleic acid-binding protein